MPSSTSSLNVDFLLSSFTDCRKCDIMGSLNISSILQLFISYYLILPSIFFMHQLDRHVALGRYVYDPKRFKIGYNNSRTYQGFLQKTGELVWIKMARLRTQTCSGHKTPDLQTLRQMQAFSKLNHSHIVQILQVTQTQNHLYIIWQRCQTSLQNQINKIKTPEEIFTIFIDLVIGLCVLRSNGYVHVGFNAGSVGVGDSNCKLMDLDDCVHQSLASGLVKMKGIGQMYWRDVAPETLKFNQLTQKSLIWNLGIILYRLLFHKYPYEELSKDELISIKCRHNSLAIETDPFLAIILKGCIKINPSDRFSLKQLLRCLLSDQNCTQQFRTIILAKISTLKQCIDLPERDQLLSKYEQMKQIENEINYIYLLQRTIFLLKRSEIKLKQTPLYGLTKFIIRCRLKKLLQSSYWKGDKVSSQLERDKESIRQTQQNDQSGEYSRELMSEQYCFFQGKDYRYKQIVYLQYQVFLRQFITKNTKFLLITSPQLLPTFKYAIYSIDFAISLFQLGEELIVGSQHHRWSLLNQQMKKLAEAPLDCNIDKVFNGVTKKIRQIGIND